jgi:hypothetical protein
MMNIIIRANYNVPYKVDTTRKRDCLKCWLPLGKIIDVARTEIAGRILKRRHLEKGRYS